MFRYWFLEDPRFNFNLIPGRQALDAESWLNPATHRHLLLRHSASLVAAQSALIAQGPKILPGG